MSIKSREKDVEKLKSAKKLLDQIIEGATDAESNLGGVLRLCMRLGSILNNEPLSIWARKEASGYEHEVDEVPEYRKFELPVYGDFLGPMNYRLSNAHIPKAAIDKKHQDALFSAKVYDSVGEIERMTSKPNSGGMLKLPWSADAIAYYQRKEIYSNGVVLASAWRLMTQSTMAGILETVRTRVLDFALKIDDELEAVENTNDASEVESSKITQIFNTTVTGGSVAISGTGDVTQTVSAVNEGDLDSLKKALLELGVGGKDIDALEIAMKKERTSKSSLSPEVSSWLSRVLIKGSKGAAAVASNAIGGLLAQALARYYGIN